MVSNFKLNLAAVPILLRCSLSGDSRMIWWLRGAELLQMLWIYVRNVVLLGWRCCCSARGLLDFLSCYVII